MIQPLEKVRHYYERVDANDIEWVSALFADHAIYERADSRFVGKTAIREFFAVHRKIRGVHSLEQIWSVEDDVVVVKGCFNGVGADGEPRSIGFSDIWYFDAGGRVSKRQSYLAIGHEYIEA